MSDLRNSRPEYHAQSPYIGLDRPGIAAIDAVWNERNGWEITITPTPMMLKNSNLKEEWISRVRDAEVQMRADIVGKWPADKPMPPEFEAYYRAATSIQNPILDMKDGSYTIRAYGGNDDCKLELALLLDIFRETEFDKTYAGTNDKGDAYKMLGFTERYVFPHQLGIAEYMQARKGAGATLLS